MHKWSLSYFMHSDAEFISPTPLEFDKLEQFVNLVTTVSASIAPAVAILGLTASFVSWLSKAALQNVYVPNAFIHADSITH